MAGNPIIQRCVIWLFGADVYAYQLCEMVDSASPPTTFDDFVQGSYGITMVGLRYAGSPTILSANLPKQPYTGPLGAISGSSLPWWWTAGHDAIPPLIQTPPSHKTTAVPYYY